MQEEQDPQDTATLSDSMSEPEVVQQTVKARSVYGALVLIGKTSGKLYGTNGRRADMMKFDLTNHSVFVGNSFIVHYGHVNTNTLETASTKIEDIDTLPWMTDDEKQLDPVELFRAHYLSRPNGSEKYMMSNFKAKDIDEMTDDEIMQGIPRAEARIRLEAWILCASLCGHLEKYVRSQPGWKDGNWWWSPCPEGQTGTQLVIKTDWWDRKHDTEWRLNGNTVLSTNNTGLANIYATDPEMRRTFCMAGKLKKLAKVLAQEAFKLEARAKCWDIDPIVCEVNRVVEYIETGRERKA